jgi:CheY-like chemotaxis protein
VTEPNPVDLRKENFLAMLGHELRNPVAAITMAAESLRHLCAGDNDVAPMIDIILRQCSHTARLLDDLLDVSRIAHGKIQLRRQRIDLVETVRTLLLDRQASIEAARLELRTDLPSEPLWVDVDPTRITQVVGNLIGNAVKFTDSPGRISIVLRSDNSRNEAVLEVADTGLGIDPANIAHIFDPFHQASRDGERNREGLGLGLALAKGLIGMHSGRICAESEGSGRGTRFIITLPLVIDTKENAPARTASKPGSRRVLLIDDSPDVVQSLQFLFSMWGHELFVAYHGQQGIDLARRERPEIILCDIGLPGMSGYDVAKALRSAPETKDAYLIAVSGFNTEEVKQRSREVGFDMHLDKPDGFTTLDRLLRDLPARG